MSDKPHRTWKAHKVGNGSSKYDYEPWRLDENVRKKQEAMEALWIGFVEWMKANNVTPDDVRWMWMRYLEEYE